LPPAPHVPSTTTATLPTPARLFTEIVNVLGAGPANAPAAPLDSPMTWALLAWVRRQLETSVTNEPVPVAPAATLYDSSVTAAQSDVTASAPMTFAAADPTALTTDQTAVTEPTALMAETTAVDPATAAVDPEPMALATSLSATPLAATTTTGATAATTASFVAAPAAAIATESTPYLPFDMPIGETDRLVFAHYVPWMPISLDNLPADRDYYTTQYLNPYGEGGAHVAYGGLVRDRPLPRDPISDPNWRFLDLVTEINQAKSVGIDGFAVDIVLPSNQNATIVNLLNAAQATGDFQIQLTADMSGPLNTFTSQQFAAAFAPYLTSPAAQ